MSNETVVCEVKPSWKLAVTKLIAVSVLAIIVAVAVGIWVEGQSPVLWFFVVLVPLGLLAVFSVWWMRLGTLLTVTPTRCVLRKGILSRSTSELRHEDIRNIQMNPVSYTHLTLPTKRIV